MESISVEVKIAFNDHTWNSIFVEIPEDIPQDKIKQTCENVVNSMFKFSSKKAEFCVISDKAIDDAIGESPSVKD
jgi:signal transduction histidine kinase